MILGRAVDDFISGRVHVHLRQKLDDGTSLYFKGGNEGHRLESTHVPIGGEAPVAFVFDQETSRAVYDALKQLFDPVTDDVRSLRKDYDAERARVDKLIDFAITPPPPDGYRAVYE